MRGVSFQPYHENLLAHQNPIVGVSEWQEWSDASGALSTFYELSDLAAELQADECRERCQKMKWDFTADPDELR